MAKKKYTLNRNWLTIPEGGGGGEPTKYIKDITKSNTTLTATKKDGSTVTWQDGSSGGGEPVFVISGSAEYLSTDQAMEITFTSESPYTELQAFYTQNGRLPRIIAHIELNRSGTTLTVIDMDLYANTVEDDVIRLVGALAEGSSSPSISYISVDLESDNQEGYIISKPLQARLTNTSTINVRDIYVANRVWFDNYFIDKPSLSTLLDTVARLEEKELPTFVNNKYLKVVNGNLQWEDAGGSGGATYYLHTVSFDTNNGDFHWQIGAITTSSTQYTSLDAFWNDIRKIVTIFGTPNLGSSYKELYLNGAMAENGTIFTRGIDDSFSVVTKDISRAIVDEQSFGDYGVEPLDYALATKKRKAKKEIKKTDTKKIGLIQWIKNKFKNRKIAR